MKNQVKNINRPVQAAGEEHIHFFHDMGHRPKRRQKHPNRQWYDDRVRYFIQECPHACTFPIERQIAQWGLVVNRYFLLEYEAMAFA